MTASTAATENESTPTRIDLAAGMERYVQFLRQQMDLQREFTITWAAAVTSLSSAVLGQWQTVEHIMAGQADQLAVRAHGAERATRDIAQQVETVAERTIVTLSDQHVVSPPRGGHRDATREPSRPASADASAEHVKTTPDIFDELLELVVDEDIMAAIP
jgi:hypothetical protein